MKFQIILIDFPLNYNSRFAGGEVKNKTKFGGGAEKHYKLMKDEDIIALKPYVDMVVDENCIMFLWVTCPKLPFCLSVIEKWGFQYATVSHTWIKTYKNGEICKNPGYYTASNMEPVFIATRGKQYINKRGEICYKKIKPKFAEPFKKMISQVVVSPRLKHSQKPEKIQDDIELMYPGYNFLELFARRERKDWTCLGNEISGNDITKDLQYLAKTQNI